MDERLLRQQIRAADRFAGPAPRVERVAERVRARAAAGRRGPLVPIAWAAMLVVAVGAGFALLWSRDGVPLTQDGPVAVHVHGGADATDSDTPTRQQALAELQAIREELARSQRLVARLESIQRGDLDPPPVSWVPRPSAEREVERAASTLIYTAQRYEQSGMTAPALRAYRRTVELFPATPAADLARRTLAALEHQTGGTS